MKITQVQFRSAADALTQILPMTQPADAVLSQYFRLNKQLGQQERAFIADTVFALLRRRYALEFHTGADSPRRLLLAYFNRVEGMSLRQLEPLFGVDAEWTLALKTPREIPAPLAVNAELPQWLVEMLAPQMTEEEILALGRALQQPAPLDLRVNPLLTNRDEVLQVLAADAIDATPTPWSPLGVRLAGKPALNRHPLFTSGKVEVQDEGSQLLCYLLAPKRREMVVDFCAGAGGKTLLLGALMQSAGRLYAFDVSESRLNKLTPRLRRSQLSNVHPQLLDSEHDPRVRRLARKIDRVLVDAPCSGFGTLRRNPDLKWRQNARGIAELAVKQRAILAAAAGLVKAGGRLVYATCSFLRMENRDVVADFLASHPSFRLLPAAEVLRQQHIEIDTGEFLELAPHRHGCDGFFAAVMERNPI
jgi:16S rRNA (cytosine967-C5)-methyltransferase